MRFCEIELSFKQGFPIKRKDWNYSIVYKAGESIDVDSIMADDWELANTDESLAETMCAEDAPIIEPHAYDFNETMESTLMEISSCNIKILYALRGFNERLSNVEKVCLKQE